MTCSDSHFTIKECSFAIRANEIFIGGTFSAVPTNERATLKAPPVCIRVAAWHVGN